MDHFPIFKLVTLIARQLSSPIATRIKNYAILNSGYGRLMCTQTGRLYKNADLRFKMWTLNLGQPVHVTPLSDREAIEIGGNLMGEFVLFFIGCCIIIFEVNRQAANKEVKKLQKRSEWLALRVTLEEIEKELKLQQIDLDQMLNTLMNLKQKKENPELTADPGENTSEREGQARRLPSSTPSTSPVSTPPNVNNHTTKKKSESY